MDNEVLKKVAKLGVLARKQGSVKIDFSRLLTDHDYANQLLNQLEAYNDEELLLLCLKLKVDLGILPRNLGSESSKTEKNETKRYVNTLR
jgi:hypothetical protein